MVGFRIEYIFERRLQDIPNRLVNETPASDITILQDVRVPVREHAVVEIKVIHGREIHRRLPSYTSDTTSTL